MIKSELVQKISSKFTDIAENTIEDASNLIVEQMIGALSTGQRIEIRNFGSFAVNLVNARQAHNPSTLEKVIVQPKYKASFRPGKNLKERVNASMAICALSKDEQL